MTKKKADELLEESLSYLRVSTPSIKQEDSLPRPQHFHIGPYPELMTVTLKLINVKVICEI
jgi:hypothetical protein